MYRRDASQVVSTAADGTDPRHLGAYGHLNALTYSYALPGGPDQLTAHLVPASSVPLPRFTALNPGRLLAVYRGASKVWEGKLDEPTPDSGGWALTAHGAGTYGGDYMAHYTAWGTAGNPVTQAISRGLRWTAPASWPALYLDDKPDDASTTITDYLNNTTGPAGLTWYVGRRNQLAVFTVPTAVTRILVATAPQARTLFGYWTTLWLRYESAADNVNTGAAAVYSTTSVTNSAQAAKHGVMETYADLSNVGVQNASAAQATGTTMMARYKAAAYAGPLTVAPGQLLTLGGVPVDLGCEQAGEIYRLVLAGGGYGGEVAPAPPVTFLGGGTTYDDVTQTLQITPWQYAANDLAGLLSSWVTAHTPKTSS